MGTPKYIRYFPVPHLLFPVIPENQYGFLQGSLVQLEIQAGHYSAGGRKYTSLPGKSQTQHALLRNS